MCGIAAVFESNGAAEPLDLDALMHRGPDARGEWASPDGRIWFGHTRLAVLEFGGFHEQVFDGTHWTGAVHVGKRAWLRRRWTAPPASPHLRRRARRRVVPCAVRPTPHS